jgi:glycosyltransferase involved in cell wall biosynthesis
LASRTEGQSNALLEAMACGLPVVASCVGGTPEIVSEGKNGLLFETENTSQYASKLATLITSPVIWMQMGMNARDTVLAQANIVTTTHRICDLYQELM